MQHMCMNNFTDMDIDTNVDQGSGFENMVQHVQAPLPTLGQTVPLGVPGLAGFPTAGAGSWPPNLLAAMQQAPQLPLDLSSTSPVPLSPGAQFSPQDGVH